MHGHDPHFVTRDLHVAFDLGARRAQPGDEALQRRSFAPLVVEREIEEFVERVVCFRAKPREEALPAAAGAEQPTRKMQTAICRCAASRKLIESRGGYRKNLALGRFALQRCPQRACGPRSAGDLEQVLVGEAEQRAAQHGRKRQIVLPAAAARRQAPSGP